LAEAIDRIRHANRHSERKNHINDEQRKRFVALKSAKYRSHRRRLGSRLKSTRATFRLLFPEGRLT
jgi:hypothetical protein